MWSEDVKYGLRESSKIGRRCTKHFTIRVRKTSKWKFHKWIRSFFPYQLSLSLWWGGIFLFPRSCLLSLSIFISISQRFFSGACVCVRKKFYFISTWRVSSEKIYSITCLHSVYLLIVYPFVSTLFNLTWKIWWH